MGDRSRIAGFRILGRLCDMSAVYLAFDEGLQRRVALRVVAEDHHLDAKGREDLMRRSRMLARLEHPNLCEVYDYLETDETHYLVLEPVSGRSLRQAMSHGLDRKRALAYAEQICSAIVAAHGQGIVHRELRPDSVWITDEEVIKVFDFGLCNDPCEAVNHHPKAEHDFDARATVDLSSRAEPARTPESSDFDGRSTVDLGSNAELAKMLAARESSETGDADRAFDARSTLDFGSNPSIAAAIAARVEGLSDSELDERDTVDLGSSDQLAAALASFRKAKVAKRQSEAHAKASASAKKDEQRPQDYAYMSPERARGGSSAAPGDMYAFGLILQEMLSAEPARDLSRAAESLAERAGRGDRREFVDSSTELVELVSMLCAKTPASRVVATEALEALRRAHEQG